jgi:hypothetical protein
MKALPGDQRNVDPVFQAHATLGICPQYGQMGSVAPAYSLLPDEIAGAGQAP